MGQRFASRSASSFLKSSRERSGLNASSVFSRVTIFRSLKKRAVAGAHAARPLWPRR